MIEGGFAQHGLIARGGFDFAEGEAAPCGLSGESAKAVLLVGHAGDAYWPHFREWLTTQPQHLDNPLDTWSRGVIGKIAAQFGALAVYPSDRPYMPFQQWAMRAEGLRPSPVGILMHPRYGLWHAYRGALLFDRPLGMPASPAINHLCDACEEKPCLKTCPAGAYSSTGFAYEDCLSHARGPHGAACREGGCLARNSCPHGRSFRYGPEAQAFHMHAFLR